jgi:hypothetical protein
LRLEANSKYESGVLECYVSAESIMKLKIMRELLSFQIASTIFEKAKDKTKIGDY